MKPVSNICRPFNSLGREITTKEICSALDQIGNVPPNFESSELAYYIIDRKEEVSHGDRMEAVNKLMQRLRKAGLAQYKKKRWTVNRRQWQEIQDAVLKARFA